MIIYHVVSFPPNNGVDGLLNPDDSSGIPSSTPDSPLNSSLDYRSIYQDIPAIFHQGGGKRGGIRLNTNSIQDLSLLLASTQNIPKSPLSSHHSSSRHLVHTSSCRSHHLSLLNNVRTPYSSNLPENEFDPIATSRNHNAAHRFKQHDSAEAVNEPTYTDYGNRNNTYVDGMR